MNGSAILNETASTPHSWPFHVFIYKHITRVTLNNNQNNETEKWRSYQILKNKDNSLGEGTFADVYKIKEKKN